MKYKNVRSCLNCNHRWVCVFRIELETLLDKSDRLWNSHAKGVNAKLDIFKIVAKNCDVFQELQGGM